MGSNAQKRLSYIRRELHPMLPEAGSLSDGDDRELAQRVRSELTGRAECFAKEIGVVVPAGSLQDTTNGSNEAAGGSSCFTFQTIGKQIDSRSICPSSLPSLLKCQPSLDEERSREAGKLRQDVLDAQLLIALTKFTPVPQGRSVRSESTVGSEVVPVISDRQHLQQSAQTKMIPSLFEDVEFREFIQDLTRLARKKSMAPPLLLSCVVSESELTDAEMQDAPVEITERKETLTRAIYAMLWRQELDMILSSTMQQEGFDFTHLSSHQETTQQSRNFHKDQTTATEEQEVDEKIRAAKKLARDEKVKRWRERRKDRNFARKIRYPARQHLAQSRRRNKGQFVSNKES